MTSATMPGARLSRPPRWRRFVRPVVLLVVAATLAYGLYQWLRPVGPVAPIVTATVRRGSLVSTVSASGNVQPIAQTALNFSAGGAVSEVLVKEGDRVKAGQPLARLQATELELAAQVDEANLRQARLKLEQAREGPKAEDIAAAQAKLDSATASLAGVRR